MPDLLTQTLQSIWETCQDPYQRMNALRDWVNQHYGETFEFYLEDVWNDHQPGQTWFEYIIRSRRTLEETPALAYDIYLNHQDGRGVWHLDDYQHTVLNIENIQPIVDFLSERTAD